jgi:hypothetical protein
MAHDLVVLSGHGFVLVAPLLLLLLMLNFRAFSQVHMSFYGLILLISLYTPQLLSPTRLVERIVIRVTKAMHLIVLSSIET